MSLADRLSQVLGRRPTAVRHLSNGHVGDIFLAEFPGGQRAVVKLDSTDHPGLELEARMLRELGSRQVVPVPTVWYSDPTLLVMDFIETGSFSPRAEEHAADLLVALHSVSADRYGYGYDTLIGGLAQPNGWLESWPRFFAERRLHFMGQRAHDEGRLAAAVVRRLERLAGDIERWIPEPNRPGLIHGDLWSGNVLVRGEQIVGLIDPAIHFADPEIELAFITLFSTFGERFFHRYASRRPISRDFFEVRRHLYNLYPLLVHVRLFGGGYVGQVEGTLKRLGY